MNTTVRNKRMSEEEVFKFKARNTGRMAYR